MHVVPAANLACPLDHTPLTQQGMSLLCPHGHNFDIARQGYINLLPVQHKRSRDPGDTKEMLLARNEFLSAGWYEAVSDRLNRMVADRLPPQEKVCVLDAGCGEGYYLQRLQHALKSSGRFSALNLIGMDISRPAIQQAARRSREISWIVGNNSQPPIVSESVDCVVCVFGFHSFAGFTQVLKSAGTVVLVEPGEDHLKQLREIIYPSLKQKDYAAAQVPGFTLVDEQRLSFELNRLSNASIQQLLLMTPHLHRAQQAGREQALQRESLTTEVDMWFRVYQKNNE